jgi:hypothetical protein
MNFKKWVKSIQTAGYNGARTVCESETSGIFNFGVLTLSALSFLKQIFLTKNVSIFHLTHTRHSVLRRNQTADFLQFRDRFKCATIRLSMDKSPSIHIYCRPIQAMRATAE